MKTFKQMARANGFKATNVNRIEFEDGIGAQIGPNFIKDEKFYTLDQTMEACGYEVKFTSGKFQATSGDNAVKQLTDALKEAGVKAYQLQHKPNEYAADEYFIKVNYVI